MDEPILVAQIERVDEGHIRVLSPAVGHWSELPREGALVGPRSRVGMLRRLTRAFRLELPDGVSGRVIDGLPRRRVVAVEYGQLLFLVAPLAATNGATLTEAAPALTGHVAGVGPGLRAIVAPTDGVFYRRPSPDDPPFVEPGARVALGQAVGLVEVMKTFNQIVYGGPGWPERAEVVELRAADGAEVRAGEVLLVVR